MLDSSHLSVLARLLDVARPGALFPDVRGLKEWFALLATPWKGRTAPRPELHRASGLPTQRSLDRLLERQRLARAFFDARHVRPPRASDQFNVALAAAQLWAPGTSVRVMAAERAQSRLLVVHDRFDGDGTLVRFSVQLEQRGSKHVKVARGTVANPTGPFELAVEQACDGGAGAAALRFAALEGLAVHEVVRGELGPCVTAQAGALADLKPDAGEGVLSLVLERVGATVTAAYCADAWPAIDDFSTACATHGWALSRERRLACTPALEPQLKARAGKSRMLVRSR